MRIPSIVLASVLAFSTTASADQLADDRAAAASRVYAALQIRPAGSPPPEELYRWSVRWLDAELDAHPRSASKTFADHAKRMADLEASVQASYKAALVDAIAVEEASYYRLEADLWAKRGKK